MNKSVGIIGFLLLNFSLVVSGEEPFTVSAALNSSDEGEVVLSVSFSIQDHHYLYADQIKIEATGDIELIPKNIPEPKQKYDQSTDKTLGIYEQDTTFTYLVKRHTKGPIKLKVQYQGCSENMCFLPVTKAFSLSIEGEERTAPEVEQKSTVQPAPAASEDWQDLVKNFTISGRTAGYLKPEKFIKFLDAAEAGEGLDGDRLIGVFEQKGVWVLVILIILGGLALNLTPCVLPMIPINIAIIGAGAQGRSRARGFVLGGLYGAGIALVYGALGLIVILTGSKFGALNSSPWFNMSIAVIFLLLSLAMFGVFSLDFSRFQGRAGPIQSGRGIFPAAFMMGGIAALLSGACVAPVLVSVLLLSSRLYFGGNIAALFLPFLLGIGMALPWPFAGAGLSLLPRPGKWMEIVKHGFGVIILLFAVWYGYLGYSLLRDRYHATGASVASSQEKRMKDDWMTSLDDALVSAQKENKPVFVDFWATSCKSCLRMDKTTFRNPEVGRRLQSYVKVKYRAEDLNDPAVKAALDHFGAIGLPTYLVLYPVRQ